MHKRVILLKGANRRKIAIWPEVWVMSKKEGQSGAGESLLAIINYRLLKGNPAIPPARAAIQALIEKAGPGGKESPKEKDEEE